MKFTINKTMVASSVTLALGVSVANAELVTNLGPNQSNDSGNFTMLEGIRIYGGWHQRCQYELERYRL